MLTKLVEPDGRTDDLRCKQALSQLSYGPLSGAASISEGQSGGGVQVPDTACPDDRCYLRMVAGGQPFF